MLGVRKRWRVRHWPIRYKFVSLLLISMIVPALGLGGLVSWAVDRIIERQVNENTLQLISQVNRTLEFYVNNMQNITYLIAFNPETKAFFIVWLPNKY